MKATAVVFPAANTVEVREGDCPEPGPRDVVVDVIHSEISNGTEGSYLRGKRIAEDTACCWAVMQIACGGFWTLVCTAVATRGAATGRRPWPDFCPTARMC